MFDIVILQWVNFFLVIGGVFFAHIISRKFMNFYVGVPLIVWLFQALLFYMVYFSYIYGIIIIPYEVADKIYEYWATFSKMFGLMTMYVYLYYIYKSCWRGNGT